MQKKLVAISAITIMLMSVFVGFANIDTSYAETSEDTLWQYEVLENGTVKTTKYLGNEAQVVVPHIIDGKFVTVIGQDTFTVSYDGVTKLGMKFITSIELPNTLQRIEFRGIFDTNITTLHIPGGMVSIESSAILWNTNLEEITVSELNPNFYIYNGLFYFKDHRLVTVPNALTGIVGLDPLTTGILTNAFYKTVADIVIPTTITTLDTWVSNLAQSYNNRVLYLAPGHTEVEYTTDTWPERITLCTHYDDTVTGAHQDATVTEYAIVTIGDNVGYVTIGDTASKPTDLPGIETTYYTNEAKTEEYDWETPVTEDVTLYSVTTEVPIDGQWKVIFLDEDGSVLEQVSVDDGSKVSSTDAPDGYDWYIDAQHKIEFDWESPVTGNILVYGVAVAAADSVWSVSTATYLIIATAIFGLIAFYTRNPYVALITLVLGVLSVLFYTGKLPLDLSDWRSRLLW